MEVARLQRFLDRSYEFAIDKGFMSTGSTLQTFGQVTRPPTFSWLVDEVDYGAGELHRHIFGYFEGHPYIAHVKNIHVREAVWTPRVPEPNRRLHEVEKANLA